MLRVSPRIAVLGISCVGVLAQAQGIPHTVEWTASVSAHSPVDKQYTLEISGQIQPGWHVYALTQGPGGPVALRIALEPNELVRGTGAPVGPPPQRRHDAGLGLDTEFYTNSFTIRLPVQAVRSLTNGELLAVSVRFQSCSDQACLPPASIRLSAPFRGADRT